MRGFWPTILLVLAFPVVGVFTFLVGGVVFMQLWQAIWRTEPNMPAVLVLACVPIGIVWWQLIAWYNEPATRHR